MSEPRPSRIAIVVGALALVVWLALVAMWLARALSAQQSLAAVGLPDRYIDSRVLYGVAFGAAGLFGLWTWYRAAKRPTLPNLLVASLGYLPLWQASVYLADQLGFATIRSALGQLGPAVAFFIGLAWLIWYVERRWTAHQRELATEPAPDRPALIWSPLHPRAWYYGRRGAKLNQSLAVLATYTLAFCGLFLLAGRMQGCREVYEIPGGGGRKQAVAQKVKIQKVIRRKFVLNPYSSVIMKERIIDDIVMDFDKITRKQYEAGDGEGDGAGFPGGKKGEKIRFIRLEYSGGDWDQDFGLSLDLNMLIQYGVRTGHPVADQTESFPIARLNNFTVDSCPPLLYVTGQKQIVLSKSEVKTLREYLIDKHGMLFIDNGGSREFHSQVMNMMRQIAPEIEPVTVPLDDDIHTCQYEIPFLPYVAPHGGREAKGWKHEGRWIAYYHPGDIGDAWSDGHSGVKKEVWEACYQLGVNVIFYAHYEYVKWQKSRRPGP